MKKGDPLLTNQWFRTGKLLVNLNWIAWVELVEKEEPKEEETAVIYMAAGKRKGKKIKLNEKDTKRFKEVFEPLPE